MDFFIPSTASAAALVMMLVLVLSGSDIADAYATTSPFSPARSLVSSSRRSSGKLRGRVHERSESDSLVTLYLFPSPPSVLAANNPQNNMPQPLSRDPKHACRPSTHLPMGSAVLAESDVLPSFQAAHGLLSPEVVSRIADSNDLDLDGPLHKFLMTYKRSGPMACVPMLSDPSILPTLIQAMRQIA